MYFFQAMTDEAILRVTPLNAYHKSIPAVNGTTHIEGQLPPTASLVSNFGWWFYSDGRQMGQTFLIFRAEQKPTTTNGKEKYFLQIHHDLYLYTGRQSKCKHNDRK